MGYFEEPGRLVGHVLLDIAAAYDESDDSGANGEASNLALRRIGEIEDAYVITVDGDGDDLSVNLDLSHLLGGAVVTVTRLVDQLAAARGVDRAVVISETREYLDS